MKFSILTLSLLSVLLFSCGTSNKYIADDIYVLKPSDLPIGESSADETSYAAFKKRKDGPTRNDQQLYADQFYSNSYRSCLSEPFWYEGCGCSYATWAQRSRYSNYNMAMNQGYYYNPYYGYFYMVPAGSYSLYHNIDGYYGGYGFGYNHYNGYIHSNMYGYNNPYGYYNGYGYNSGYGYGYNNGYGYYNGYGGYGGNSSPNTVNNFHNGARGTSSGYSNPNGRQATNGPTKSVVNNGNSGGTYSHSSTATNSQTVRRSISTIDNVPSSPTTKQGNAGTTTRDAGVTQGRTYQRSSEATNPNVTRQPSVTRDPATRSPNTSPVQRQSTNEPVQRSGNFEQRSNQNNGATRSPENNSAPRTNTNTNTGRRP